MNLLAMKNSSFKYHEIAFQAYKDLPYFTRMYKLSIGKENFSKAICNVILTDRYGYCLTNTFES